MPKEPESLGKIGLVLSGGIGKGFFHVGALIAIVKCNVPFSYIAAVSAGALAAAKLLEVLPDSDALEQFVHVHLSRPPFRMRKNLLRSIYESRGLIELINTLDIKKIQNSEIELHVIATDFISGRGKNFSNHKESAETFRQSLLASSALPGFFEPVSINNRDYIDGGMVKPLPVLDAIEEGCETIIVIDGDPRNPELSLERYKKKRWTKVGRVLARAYSFALHQLAQKELQEAQRMGRRIIVIRPSKPPLEVSTKWNAQDVARMIAEGKQVAEQELRKALLIEK